MKNYLLVFLTILSTSLISAQKSKNKLSLSINTFRYAPPSGGYYDTDEGAAELSFINGFSIGYQQNSLLGYMLNFRNIKSYLIEYGIDSYRKLSTNGVEISMGPTLSSKEYHKFTLLFSLEIFADFTKVRGWYTLGGGPTYEKYHYKNYFGIAPSLHFNFKITERIFLYAKTRYRLGKVYYNLTKDAIFENPTSIANQKFVSYQYEPLSGFGLKLLF